MVTTGISGAREPHDNSLFARFEVLNPPEYLLAGNEDSWLPRLMRLGEFLVLPVRREKKITQEFISLITFS